MADQPTFYDCARCGKKVLRTEARGTLFENLFVHAEACHPPGDRRAELLKVAAKLTENYWEGRYYPGAGDDRERLVAKDLAEMLDRVLEEVAR
jgi:hypothetical protein